MRNTTTFRPDWYALDENHVIIANNMLNRYEDIDRDRMCYFSIGFPKTLAVIPIIPLENQNIKNLVYRKRTFVGSRGTKSHLVIAGYPNPTNKQLYVIDENLKTEIVELDKGVPGLHDITYRPQELKYVMRPTHSIAGR